MNTPPYYLSRDGAHDLTPLVAPLPYYVGATIKYLTRAGRKPGVPAADDLRKAAHCALLAVEHDPNRLDRTMITSALVRDWEWCHPHAHARALWGNLTMANPCAVVQYAYALLAALDTGEVP